ncbi:SDR family NAD(P)-dependent oxidoreductase, partial [Streptomyces sp. NPDC007206]|uniref:SDR family NAD(P)-dependent oxidoreductase n=1 Tax=Streptomyces sp. NPDC007206 TaxID=3154317 RepID=UPI0033F3BB52
PFYLVRERQPWPAPKDADGRELPRRAGVSSFGFGGVNAHVVLEEYVPPAPALATPPADEPVAVLLSAADQDTLRARARDLLAWIDAGRIRENDLTALAHTLQTGRVAMDERLGFVTDSLADAGDRLRAYLEGGTIPGVHAGRAARQEAWNTLTADEDVARAVDQWIARGNLDRVVKLWTTGCDVDWSRLHAGRPVRRIPLPAYPFRLRRYWIADRNHGHRPEAAPPAGTGERLRRLDGQEPYLADHRVLDVPTLPGAAHVEFVREALTASTPGAPATGVRLRDVTWLRPVRVTEPRTLRITLTPCGGDTGDTAERTFEVRADDAPDVHARGTAQLDPALRDAPAETRDIDALRAGCPRRRDADECYALFARMGLDYGPALRTVQTLYHGPDGALARLRLPARAAGLTTDPSMLDGALQATLGVLLEERDDEPAAGSAAVPFTVREIRLLRPTPAEGWAVVRRAADDRGEGRLRRLDVDLCDDRGTVCVRLLGFSTRAIQTPPTTAPTRAVPDTATASTADTDAALLAHIAWQDHTGTGRDTHRGTPGHVVLCELPGIDAPELARTLGAGCEVWQADGDAAARYAAHAERLLALLREAARDHADEPRLLQVVTPAHAPWLAGLNGMLRTARAEHPKLLTQWIETAVPATADDLAAVLRRAAADPDEDAVRHVDGCLRAPRWRELTVPAPAAPWRDRGVYLLTGGAGGLGAVLAKDIAQRVSDPVLVLCGRSPAGAAHTRLLGTLRDSGARAEYRVLDVTDRAAVLTAVRETETRYGALHGVVHAAGVLRDGFLATKSADDLRDVLAVKAAGLVHLDEATAGCDLDCFIAFSSMAAFGNAGQADYAAANAFLDAYAAHRQDLVGKGERRGRTLSVNWPLWQEGGMRAGAGALAAMERAGLRALDADAGLDALHRAWAGALPQVIVVHGDHDRIREQFLPGTAAPQAPADGRPHTADTGRPPAPAADRVTALLAEVLELDPAELKPDVPLRRYGFDSIFQVQFLARAQRDIDPELTLDTLVDSETLQDLVTALGGPGREDTAPATPALPPSGEPVPDPAQAAASVLVRMNGVTTGRPVFWVHDGNGGIGGYAPLAARCRRPFYGIIPKGWTGTEDILTGQEAMARYYVAAMRSVQPDGPYDVGGFSLGGLFAYEVVRELQAQGQEVSSFVMLDTLDGIATNRANDLVLGGRADADARAKVSLFRAVNLVLGDNRLTAPDDASPVLHRDEVDPTLDVDAFLNSLIKAALERGVDRTEGQLRTRVRQLARYFDAVQGETYTVRPLPRPDQVPCHYVRNKGGEFFGAYEEYMVLFPNPDLPSVDGTAYWRAWEGHIEDFTVVDVDTVTHSDVMSAPHALEKILDLCDTLYGPQGPAHDAATAPARDAGAPVQEHTAGDRTSDPSARGGS